MSSAGDPQILGPAPSSPSRPGSVGGGSVPGSLLTPGRMRWALLMPLLVLTVSYLVIVVVKFDGFVAWTYQNADSASAPVIGQMFGASGSHVTLGNYAWYWSLMYELATRWVPDHRQFWELSPYLVAVLAAALTVRSVYSIAGALSAWLSATILLCASPVVLYLELSLNDHSPTWLCLAVLGWWLAMLERGAVQRRAWICAAGILAVGAVVGPEAASDPLVAVAGIVPFAGAVLLLRVLGDRADRRHVVVPAVATIIAIGVGWLLTKGLMADLDVVKGANPYGAFAAAGQVSSNLLGLWWQSVVNIGSGSFFGRQLSLTSGIELICAVIALASVILIPRLGWLEVSAGRVPRAGTAESTHRALVVFWVLSALLLSLAYITSSAPADIESERYLVGLIYPVAVVFPLVASRRPAAMVATYIAACIYAISGVLGLIDGQIFTVVDELPSESTFSAMITYAQRHDLHLGYAGYWDAAPLTWASHLKLDVYPVASCGTTMCPSPIHTISSWYTQRARRSFIITDSTLPILGSPPAGLGKPVATYAVAELTMYVYDYDVATKIG